MAGQPDLAELLLGLAYDDLFAAKSLLPIDGVADSILGFHCQQAVEKSLKATLAHRHVDYPHTHDLDGLIELCRTSGLDVPQDLDDVDQLAPFGVHTRYGTSRSILDREQALRWARAALTWARTVVANDSV